MRIVGTRLTYTRGVVTSKAPDDVVRLRVRGAEQVIELPLAAPGTQLVVGAAESCDIVVRDPAGRVSRRHAYLVRERDAWILHDRESTNGIRQDGERRLSIELAPAVEVELGGLTLIAESPRLVSLRAYLSRIVGWDPARIVDVDHGIQAVRTMATRRAALVLCGDGDLGGVARRIHGLALGEDRPFVLCGRNEVSAGGPASSATFCFADDTLPDDFGAIAARLTATESRARLIACSPSREDATEAMAELGRSAILELPALPTRPGDIERLILEYAGDAARALGAPSNGFREHEMVWLQDVPFSTLAEIEESTYRLVALRNWSVRGGAQRLGISHVALSRWARRRRIPT
jgi:hypothetical protein